MEQPPTPIMATKQTRTDMNDLPNELLIQILSHLGPKQLTCASRTCRHWMEIIAKTPQLRQARFLDQASTGDPTINPVLPLELDDERSHRKLSQEQLFPVFLDEDSGSYWPQRRAKDFSAATLFKALGGERWHLTSGWRHPSESWRNMLVVNTGTISTLATCETYWYLPDYVEVKKGGPVTMGHLVDCLWWVVEDRVEREIDPGRYKSSDNPNFLDVARELEFSLDFHEVPGTLLIWLPDDINVN